MDKSFLRVDTSRGIGHVWERSGSSFASGCSGLRCNHRSGHCPVQKIQLSRIIHEISTGPTTREPLQVKHLSVRVAQTRQGHRSIPDMRGGLTSVRFCYCDV